MIRHIDKAQALSCMGQMYLSFVENPDVMMSPEDRKKYRAWEIHQDHPLWFPPNGEFNGVVNGDAVFGYPPTNDYEMEQLRQNWAVIRTADDSKVTADLDYEPPTVTAIVALMVGRKSPSLGFICEHRWEYENEKYPRREMVFLEYVPSGTELGPVPTVQVTTVAAPDGSLDGIGVKREFLPQSMNTVYAWAYLSKDAVMYTPKELDHHGHIFMNVKYDEEIDRVCSMALVTKLGAAYYAFDSDAFQSATQTQIAQECIPAMFNVPPRTLVSDLNTMGWPTGGGFLDWFRLIVEEEHLRHYKTVTIHVQDWTDVACIVNLLRVSMSEVFKYTKVHFVTHSARTYPNNIEKAVQHNAAWDATALWHHQGYHLFQVLARAGGMVRNATVQIQEQEKPVVATDDTKEWGWDLRRTSNPRYPGLVLLEDVMLPSALSPGQVSQYTDLTIEQIAGILNGSVRIDIPIAQALEKGLHSMGGTAAWWINLQRAYDLKAPINTVEVLQGQPRTAVPANGLGLYTDLAAAIEEADAATPAFRKAEVMAMVLKGNKAAPVRESNGAVLGTYDVEGQSWKVTPTPPDDGARERKMANDIFDVWRKDANIPLMAYVDSVPSMDEVPSPTELRQMARPESDPPVN